MCVYVWVGWLKSFTQTSLEKLKKGGSGRHIPVARRLFNLLVHRRVFWHQ